MTETLNNKNQEANQNTAFDSLAEMYEDYNLSKAEQLVATESNELTKEESQSNLSLQQSKEELLNAYGKSKSDLALNETTAQAKIEQSQDVKPKGLTGIYDSRERARIDKIKSNITYADDPAYRYQQSRTLPTPFQKTMRLIGDALGIKTKKSEESRNREAIRIALSEKKAEMDEMFRLGKEMREREEREEKAREEQKKREREEQRLKIEKEKYEKDMSAARDYFDRYRKERFEKQRTQEIAERELNSKLLKVDDLETEVLAENPEVDKHFISYEDTEIPVYDLKGVPFCFLSNTVDFKKGADKFMADAIGSETYKIVMENPSFRAMRRDEVEVVGGFERFGKNAKGDTISTSYWNSEKNIKSYVGGELIYGFDHVDPDSILDYYSQDGGTSNTGGEGETSIRDENIVEALEDPNLPNNYNEVKIRRYSETGNPKLPDYIIVENGNISEASLRHAKFFNIPILNVEKQAYRQKALKKGEAILATVSADDNYEELNKKMSELRSMSEFKRTVRFLSSIGKEKPFLHSAADEIEKKCFELSKMELVKRIEFIKDSLEKATKVIEDASKEGALAPDIPPEFDSFDIKMQDIWNGIESSKEKDVNIGDCCTVSGRSSHIVVGFRLKNGNGLIETNIIDGENETGNMGEQRSNKKGDSSYYNMLEPVVKKYFEAYRKNQELSK